MLQLTKLNKLVEAMAKLVRAINTTATTHRYRHRPLWMYLSQLCQQLHSQLPSLLCVSLETLVRQLLISCADMTGACQLEMKRPGLPACDGPDDEDT
jgi:hypothetical protein